jgi:small-conductance mechanosensitive channel
MQEYKTQIIESLALLVLYILGRFLVKYFVEKKLKAAQLEPTRRKIILAAAHLMLFMALTIFLSGVWGLKQEEIASFAGAIITVLGVAFVATWSLLSNITAGLMLFFNHPLKIGDFIRILEKDNYVEGEIKDITYFFIQLKAPNNEIITIPNATILQKSVAISSKK